MFWYLNYSQPLYLLPVLSPNSTQNPEIANKSELVGPQQQKNGQQNTQLNNFHLNLSIQDLKKAGYCSNKRSWSQQEDKKLKQLRDIQHLQWDQLSKFMTGRNPKMCYSRYRRLQSSTKQSWKKKDDQLLLQLVDIHGFDWKLISKQFYKRSYKQVKQHYLNYLRPSIKKDQWSLNEQLKLIEYLNKFGKNWRVIEQNFQGRTQNQIKNRYFGRLKKLAQKKLF